MSPAKSLRILGIDPGSRRTGYGVIEGLGGRYQAVTSGVIETGTGELPQRLKRIFDGILDVLNEFQPDEAAVEEVFVKLNIGTALVLGQARGAAICALAQQTLPVFEYAPARIKQSIAGHGRAEKPQMQQMVKLLLKLGAPPPADAADALAVALCHAQLRGHDLRMKTALAKATP